MDFPTLQLGEDSFFSYARYSSPLGEIWLTAQDGALTQLDFGKRLPKIIPDLSTSPTKTPTIFVEAQAWLDDYFSGQKPNSKWLKVAPNGTKFQKDVWEIVENIPYGETTTYGEIARKIAKKRRMKKMSARAVGAAVGQNPLMLIVPCHRVLSAKGEITGYAGGIEQKLWLLKHEGTCSI